jgi:hypothetical protein
VSEANQTVTKEQNAADKAKITRLKSQIERANETMARHSDNEDLKNRNRVRTLILGLREEVKVLEKKVENSQVITPTVVETI